MKYLRTYENRRRKVYKDELPYKVGYYVTINADVFKGLLDFAYEFFRDNIGKIIELRSRGGYFDKDSEVIVKFKNIPPELETYYHIDMEGGILFNIALIKDYAPTLEEMQMKLDAEKYNL